MRDFKSLKTKLKNGLSIVFKEVRNMPIISVWIWYRVGSRDEATGMTGASHFLEHMSVSRFFYNDTPFFPLIERLGGTNNAMTSLDFTTFYATIPSNHTDIVVQAFAEQMGGKGQSIRFEEVDLERNVILSERQWLENEPTFRLGEAIQQASFQKHPYHHEVIGELADLHSLTRDDLFNHYKTYYIPNNAIMAVAGDFETVQMLTRIKELYEPIPAGDTPPRLERTEPEQKGEIQLAVEGPGETTYIQVCYRFPNASHPDFFPLSVLDSLLAGPSNLNFFGGGISNKTSRLYRALVEKELAVSMSGGAQATIDPFLYNLSLTIHPQRKPEEALSALDDEIKRIQDETVSEEEVARAIKQARAIFAYGSENITNQGFWMGYSEMFADYNWFLTYLDNLAAVTPAEVQRVAQQYLQPRSRVVGTYIPNDGEA